MYNDKWVFFQLPDKKAITAEEVTYWVSNLNKILKVGLEFEFNLPTAKGFCKGKSKSCPCSMMNEMHNCWKKCLNEPDCRETFGETFDENCEAQLCSNFKSACFTCELFTVDCVACEYRYDPNRDPDGIRNYLRDTLAPSQSYGNISASGVHSVVCDGSLLGKGKEGKGAEVVTVGRRMDYWEFFNMIDGIFKESASKGAYMNERCSVHVHMLASYYDVKEGPNPRSTVSELEKPLPQIVLANFHQLCRRYQNAITWMSMGLDDIDHLTRWEKFRVSILNTSPVSKSMKDVIYELENLSGKPGGKYAWVNYMFSKFDPNSNLTRFHVEMRAMDGIMSASAVTALACLNYALIIKAIEISKYGLLEVGPKDWMEQAKELKNIIMNNTSSYDSDRLSNTSLLTDKYKQILRVESMDLINQVKHILFKLGPAYDVLEKLAEKPIAFHRCEGDTWESIENKLAVYRPVETIIDQKLFEFIDFRTFTGCTNEEDWISKVCTILENEGIATPEQINLSFSALKRNGICIWSDNLGTVLKV
jgi:hypothetical protein